MNNVSIEDLKEPLLPQVQAEPGGISIPYSNGVFHMGTTPVFTSSIYGSSEDSLYDHPGGTEVLFINLTEQTCFDKIQSRRGGLAKMRVTNGVVQMVCQSPVQILSIKVFVFREPSAAELCGDDNGRMELPVLMGNMDVQGDSRDCQQFFSVNLDSIYDGPKKPAYELAKVEMEVRNHFQLAVQVQYIGGVGYQEFTSMPFLMRSKPRNSKVQHKRRRLESEGSEERANSPDTTRPRQDSGASNGSRGSPDSVSNAEYRSVECQNLNVIDHLEAKRASINHLTFQVMESPFNADIGYRFRLKNPDLQEYDEGDVVGFFKDDDGATIIDLLDTSNVGDAFMAGVISRSAYIEAKQSLEKKISDVVCVIGVVKVKCLGSVRAGERIYSSLDQGSAGTAIAEGHLPPGAVLNKRGTLLGMALEEKTAKKVGDEMLVKCFVCIVMGITDKKLTTEIENMYDRFEMMVNARIKKERKRAKRVLITTMSVLVILLVGLSVLTYQLFYPGSALRDFFCKEGCIDGHTSTFRFTVTSRTRTYFVTGIEFPSWKALQRKLKPKLDHVEPLNLTLFNITKVHYYLNLDRCSYGEITLHAALSLDPKKEVGGPLIYAIDEKCSTVYYNTDVYYKKGCLGGWCPYQSVHMFPREFRCYPESQFHAKSRP